MSTAIDPASAIAAQGTTATTTPNGFSALTSEQFIKVIFTELSKQDPLQPSDSSKLLEQLSSIRSIQADIDMGTKLQSIVTQNQLSTAAGLIGKNISGLTEQSDRVSGQVASVSQTKTGPVLRLMGGQLVPMSSVDEILDAAPAGSGGQ
jgi:flagellar basal-body rod modification protein FlgD